jgi:S1-C subfamily serine protease
MTKFLKSAQILFFRLLIGLLVIGGLVLLTKAEAGQGWYGSGYFINANGYIATADHVVRGSTVLTVKYKNKDYVATVINQTESGDSAIIHIPVLFTPYLLLRPVVIPGEVIFTVGYPLMPKLGDNLKVNQGYVKSRNSGGYIPLNCWSAPGNSGGPVVDQSNNVIGTLTEGEGHEGGYESYARPVSNIIKLAQQANIEIHQTHDNTGRYGLNQILSKDEDIVVIVTNQGK